MNVELPDGTILTDIPEGTTREQLRTKLKANGYDVSKLGPEEATPLGNEGRRSLPKSTQAPETDNRKFFKALLGDGLGTVAGDIGAGIGKTISGAVNLTEDVVPPLALIKTLRGRRSPLAESLKEYVDPAYKEGGATAKAANLAGEIALTGGPATAAAQGVGSLIKGGGALAKTLRGGAEAATAGGVSGAMVDPGEGETRLGNAGQGAAFGVAAAPVAKLVGAGISAAAGPSTPDRLLRAAREAQEAGYVIPPTQVRQTLGNRLLEGMSGKIATAQNASAANQEVSNRLAKRAIGATEDLSPDVLAGIRSKANQAYSDLGNFGTVKADDAYAKAVRDAGQRVEGFSKDFPELVNKDVDQLIESFANKKSFDAQSAIEAIKRLREGQRAVTGNAQATAEAKAFGRTQGKLADAIEGLVERNLDEAGRPELLTAFRDARKTLAQVYDVEKAMNPASGNVDFRKLKKSLEKGRLTGDLKTGAEFAQSFPKAAQSVEGMGSLPQISPLDLFGTVVTGGLGASQQGPEGAALGLVYPAARLLSRRAVLSPSIQRGLTKPNPDPELIARILRNSGAAAGTAANDF
jgi:hypothetical protein